MKTLNDALRFAAENIPFYQSFYKADSTYDLSTFPIVNKSDYYKHSNQLILSPDYVDTEDVITFSTSGTTNRPMRIHKFKSDYYRQAKNLCKQRFITYGIKPTDRTLVVLFESVHLDKIHVEKNKMFVNANFFSKEWLKDNISYISEFKPVYAMGFTDSFMRFIYLYRDHGYQFIQSIQFIELIGEPVFNYQRRIISKMLPNAVIVENYSCTEVLGIGLSCPKGNLHLINNNVIVEIDDPNENGVGDILLTSLHSRLMPFIRYRIGDKGIIKTGKTCGCGNTNDIVEIVKGRTVEYLYFKNSKPIHMMVIHKIIEDLNTKLNDCIEKFRVKQIDEESIAFYICLNPEMKTVDSIVKTMLVKIIQRIINPQVKCFVEFVEMDFFNDERKAIHLDKGKEEKVETL